MKGALQALALAVIAAAATAAPPKEFEAFPVHPMQTRRGGIADTVKSIIAVDWSKVVATSKSVPTLQVVANPLLDRSVPVAKTFFKMLSKLPVDHVRYVPWFPYPHYGVPELDPPTATTTSWNFTYVQPMLEDFFAATHGVNHTTIPNFSTQPTWMYDTKDWSYPADPKATDFGYPRGSALLDPSGDQLAEYYARLLSWIVKGSFVDELGNTHSGGPAQKLDAWEIFNEPVGCHGMQQPEDYVALLEKIVPAIRGALGADGSDLKFVIGAIAQARDGWASFLLDPANYQTAEGRRALAEGFVSFHFYANAASRTEPAAYEAFFPQTDAFVSSHTEPIAAARDKLSPTTRLDADELGVILPGDNVAHPEPFPLVYWNAAAAKYAYVWSHFARVGVDVIGMSQLAGSPPIPEWGIVDPQYASVAILNWTDGSGTARYWTLDAIARTFSPGDEWVRSGAGTSPVCGVIDGHHGYGNMTIECAGANATVSAIDFAAFGTPSGQCGAYAHNASCDAAGVQSQVEALCLGRSSCVVPSYPHFGDPCFDTYKRLVVQARCSDGGGGFATGSPLSVHVQGIRGGSDGAKRVLVVNKASDGTSLDLTSVVPAGCSATSTTIDEATAFGPARVGPVSDPSAFALAPFAVSILELSGTCE